MGISDKLAQVFIEHRMPVAVAAMLITLAAVLALPGLKVDDNFNNLLRQAAAEDSRGLEMKKDDMACVFLVEGGRILAAGNQDAVRELVFALGEHEHVRAVHSIFDARKPVRFGRYLLPLISAAPESEEELDELQGQALNHPLIQGKMLSDNGRVTMVIAELAPELQQASELDSVLGELEAIAEEKFENTPLQARLTGIPALQVEMTEALKWEQVYFVLGAEFVGLLICFGIFRRLTAVIIVQSGPLTAVVWSLGGMAIAGEPLNIVNSVLAPLVLTIALTDSVHLVLRIRALREQGMPRHDAVKSALARVGPACFLTSLTTAVAFGSLGAANIEVIRRFGLACGSAVVLSFLAVVTMVPLLACSRLGDHVTRHNPNEALASSLLAAKLDTFIAGWRHVISGVSILATLLLLWVAVRLQPDIQMRQFLPSRGEALQTLQRTDSIFGGLLPFYVQITWEKGTRQAELLEAVEEVEKIVEQESMLSPPLSIHGVLQSLARDPDQPIRTLTPLKSLPTDKLQRLIDLREHETVVISRVPDLGTKNIEPLRQRLSERFSEMEEQWPNLQFEMTGWTVSAGRLSATMLNDMLTSLYLAVCISFVILVIAFRSFRIGLVSFVPNLFPLAATGATMVLFDLPLQFSSATVFSVCFGIAVDDTIHFLASYTHEVKSGTRSKVAIRRTLGKVGEALVVSTLIMLGAFCVVVFSSVPSISLFALVFMIVLVWALVGDLLYLPALLSLLPDGKRREKRRD